MNKYEKYINYIVNDIEPPYFINMGELYGLKPEEYKIILSKVFNQPVRIDGKIIYDNDGNIIYTESKDGEWYKKEYDTNGNTIYYENSNDFWYKQEFDSNGNEIYRETSDGYIVDKR